MATFESKFGLGDHVWYVLGDCRWSRTPWHIYEAVVREVQFTQCACSRMWYLLVDSEGPRRESELFGSLEDAVASLPEDVKCYALFRVDDKGHDISDDEEGERYEINRA